jgi:hypothetical protein
MKGWLPGYARHQRLATDLLAQPPILERPAYHAAIRSGLMEAHT